MKGITRYDGPKEGHGWLARTQWNAQLSRRRFADSTWGGKADAKTAAAMWLRETNRRKGKPVTDHWIRSRGGWGRGDKRGTWKR